MAFSRVLTTLLVAVAAGVPRAMARPQDLEDSDGCGPNPLTVVIAAASELEGMSTAEVMAMVESDQETWGEVLARIHAYDDCVRTGQLRFKRLPSAAWTSSAVQREAALRKSLGSLKSAFGLSAPLAQALPLGLTAPVKPVLPHQSFLQRLMQQTKDSLASRSSFTQ
ncbi:uncharacterized protein [Penaeus vannamei]|uniref:uncharacterized protein n=1 Tax=Penaeus vannamei TaxID=6689 RepID=UPI00387F9C93